MVEGDQPPKNKKVTSSSGGGDIDQYDPCFLHSNDTSRVPLINFKLKDTENYSVWKAAITISIHTKNKLGFINGKLKRPEEEGFHQEQWDMCSALLEYYHKFNALWMQYDSLVNLCDCICENSENIILTTNSIPDVKGAFATLSRDESNRSTQSHNVSKTGNGNKDQSFGSSNSFTDDQYKRLMALISEKSGSSSMPANIASISCLNMNVDHPNGTKALMTHVGSLRLTDKIVIHDVLVVPSYQDFVLKTQVGTDNESNGLYFLNREEELSSEPNDDGRDSRTERGKGTDQLSHVGTEYTDDAIREDVGHPDDNASAKAHCDNLESTILEEKDSESEGDDTDYREFND
ncbi:ribonuclease H-like domain-containing protein [Tanacetum coccineum]